MHAHAYKGKAGQPAPGAIAVSGTTLQLGDVETAGVSVTGNWNRKLADGSSISVQAYVDHTERTVPPS
ncbi:hypothetical protein [Massilia cavernae]|uniref:Uncharacterized protein n=1 Tax=Massilia cavernae TaxID=2320864 RepID=A0A418Y5N8_9BURK|nr:hypothetical protein [Massilia cavernae]RJG21931.1 hypothetical protein D3872_06015 [Massilia cavernae]